MADNIDEIDNENTSVDDVLEESRGASNPMPGQGTDDNDSTDSPSKETEMDDPTKDSDVDSTEAYNEDEETPDDTQTV